VVRKLGVPGHEELAMGAVASGGVRILNDDVVMGLRIPGPMIEEVTLREVDELARREEAYRGDRLPLEAGGRTAILVDDGVATGASMLAAVQALREQAPDRIVVAVPVAPVEVSRALAARVDEVVCVATPDPFHGVGIWYQDFAQSTDEEVKELLASAWKE